MEERGARKAQKEALVLRENVGQKQAQQHREQVALVHLDAEGVDREHQHGGAGEQRLVPLGFEQQQAGEQHGERHAELAPHAVFGQRGPVQPEQRPEVVGVDRVVGVVVHRARVQLDELRVIPVPHKGRREHEHDGQREDRPEDQVFPVAPADDPEDQHRREDQHLRLREDAEAVDERRGRRVVLPEQQNGPQQEQRAVAVGLAPHGGVDDDGRAEQVCGRDEQRAVLAELFARKHPEDRRRADVREDRHDLHEQRRALRIVRDKEQAAEKLRHIQQVEVARRVVDEEIAVIHAGEADLVGVIAPGLEAGDVGVEAVDAVAEDEPQHERRREDGAENGHGRQPEQRAALRRAALGDRHAKAEPEHGDQKRRGKQNLYGHRQRSFPFFL